ncbi:MAG: ATP-binding protein [Bacteroidia bacterium]|nr:ATP-binding protein [Bacteroidia bacterium]
MKEIRYFNTSGPNIPAQHYTLMRPVLVARGQQMVERERYFTIWAPRQTGKSTYFRLLAEELSREGYRVMHINLENFLQSSVGELMQYFQREAQRQWQIDFPEQVSFEQLFNRISEIQEFRLVLVIDEIEGLNPDLFGQFLHTIRNLYHSRQNHGLKSVILVGVSNIVGVVQDNASPFNIADNLAIPYFSDEETSELLGQHETETGQRFDPKVISRISHITANQPGLVNGFAFQLIERFPDKPLLTLPDYFIVEDWYLTEAIDKNVANIINKAGQYRSFVERLLFTEERVPFHVDRPAVKLLYTNGVIRKSEDGFITFWVPLYKKRLYKAFYPYTNGEQKEIIQTIAPWNYFSPEGRLDMEKVIAEYKAYVKRRSFKYFREKDESGQYVSIKEAALMYSFETYIQAFLLACGGKSYLEPHTGPGRADLILNLENREYVVEAKVYRYPKQFQDGKKQLAGYIHSLGLAEGWYLVFVPKQLDHEQLRITEGHEKFSDVVIHTSLVFYDEEKDF